MQCCAEFSNTNEHRQTQTNGLTQTKSNRHKHMATKRHEHSHTKWNKHTHTHKCTHTGREAQAWLIANSQSPLTQMAHQGEGWWGITLLRLATSPTSVRHVTPRYPWRILPPGSGTIYHTFLDSYCRKALSADFRLTSGWLSDIRVHAAELVESRQWRASSIWSEFNLCTLKTSWTKLTGKNKTEQNKSGISRNSKHVALNI